MTSSVFSILLVSLVFCVSVVDPTGIKIRINNQALLRDRAMAFLKKFLLSQSFDILKTSVCTVDKAKMTELTIHQADLRFMQNSGFQFDIKKFDAKFSVSHQIISRTGSIDITAQGVSIKMELSLSRTQKGELDVKMPKCEASAEQMKLTYSTNPGTLANLAMGCLRFLFNSLFCPGVKKFVIPNLNNVLKTLSSFVVSEDFGISIDCSLTRDVQVTANSLDMSFNGLMFRRGENIPAPNAAVEPVITQNNLMAYVGVSETVLNSAAVAFYNARALGKKFDEITSKAAKRYLRFRQFFQQPWRMKAPLSAAVEVTETPRIGITQTQGVTVNLRVRVSAASVPANKEPKVITSVSATCDVSVKPTIQGSANGNRLRLPLNNVRCRIAISNQAKRLGAGLLEALVPLLNNKASEFLEGWFEDGFDLPLALGLVFTPASTQYQDGFMVVGGNLNLAPDEGQRVVNGDNIGR